MAEIVVQRDQGNGPAYTDETGTNKKPESPLDSDEAMQELRRCQEWFCESRDLCSENRAQRVLDHDYYDNNQWSNVERQELYNRGQAPLTYNIIAVIVDWITGTERRTRVDYAVHPRHEDGIEDATNKEKLLKYLSDVNRTGWERSRAFEDAVISGLGWTEQNVRGDSAQEMILDAYVPWQQMWRDPFGKDFAMKDSRYLHRRKWVDLDFAISLFPDREMLLRSAARSHLYSDEDLQEDELDLPQCFRRYDHSGNEIVQRRWSSAFPSDGGTTRLRVPLTETWWRCPKNVKKLWGMDFQGVVYDPKNEAHQKAHAEGYHSLTDAVTTEMRISMWVPGGMLYRGASPFKHGQFPFTPHWGKVTSNDNMEYGVVRAMRDPQDDLNHNHSKAKWILSARQFLYEENAVDPETLPETRRNLAKPNGEMKFKDGALQNNKIRIESNYEALEHLSEREQMSMAHMHDGSGVNREQLGKDSNVTAGIAIRAKQEEGSVATAKFFDNLRLSVQLAAQKDLSLIEQYMTLPVQIYLAGEGPNRGDEWLKLNQVEHLPDGSWNVKNDVTKFAADVIVDEQDYRESIRQAQSEQLWNMLSKMPPEIQIALLDLAIETTDLQNKQEWVQRIRKMNGQPDPEQANDPEAMAQAQAAEQAKQQQAEEDRQRAAAAQDAKTELDRAKAAHTIQSAKKTGLEAKATALDIAGLVRDVMPLAPAADRLYQGTNPQDNGNGTTG